MEGRDSLIFCLQVSISLCFSKCVCGSKEHFCGRIYDSGHFLPSMWLIQSPFKKGHLTVQLSLGIGKQKNNHYFHVVMG